jgi:hypothetical protein
LTDCGPTARRKDSDILVKPRPARLLHRDEHCPSR